MSEASRLMIDGMMERLGAKAALLVGDQRRETVIQSGPKGAGSRTPLAAEVPSPEAGRDADNEFLSPTVIGESDYQTDGGDRPQVTFRVLDERRGGSQFP